MQRRERNKGAKEKIAQYAAGLIGPGDFVYIDAGTTTDLMIDFITARQAVFVTNAITHAKKLAQKGCTVYILGGEFKAITEAIVGEEAVSSILGSKRNQYAARIFHTGAEGSTRKKTLHGELQRMLYLSR